MLSLYFNNVRIPNWIRVTNITEEILPGLEATKKITKLGAKKITISFSFRRKKLITSAEKNELNTWLRGDNFKESKLVLPGRENKYYYAKVSNVSEINGTLRKGTGTIEFTCFNPYEYEKNLSKLSWTGNEFKIVNYLGNEELFPNIKVTIKSQSPKIKISDDRGNFLEFNHNFLANDVLIFEQAKNKILLNSNLNQNILYLRSKRIKLYPGQNKVKLETGNADLELSWNNKCL